MINELRKAQDALSKLSFILSKEQKRYCVLIFVMSLIMAVFEVLGISAVVPIIQAVISTDDLMAQSYIAPVSALLHLKTSTGVIVCICIGIGIIYIVKNLYAVLYVWASAKFSNKIRRELAVRVLQTYMKQGYIFFVDNNSSRLIRGISADVNSVQAVVTSFFSFMCKALTIFCIALFIVINTPVMALLILGLVVFCFVLSQIIFRRPMRQYGQEAREYSSQASQASLEAIQGSKEVLVFGRQEHFVNKYLENMIGYNRAEVQMSVASAAPSYLIEMICILGLLAAIAIQLVTASPNGDLVSQMATVALAAFRILPAFGVLLGNLNTIVFNAPGLSAASDTLHMVMDLDDGTDRCSMQTLNGRSDVHLEKELVLSHISYAYPRTEKNVINDITLTIHKGTSVGLIGASGAGKTTLADIILTLLKPQSGEILMDGMNIEKLGSAWNHVISYVPQSIYMVDDSIRRNVAFGIDEALIDEGKVWKALEMAQMKEFVEKLPKRIETNVGEWGVQLSGGQRQRIAIARALYNEPDIIVLDEATAALDNETENAVMESIEALQKVKTLIIVAHRLTTIRKCDVIYEIADGKAIQRNKEEVLADVKEEDH